MNKLLKLIALPTFLFVSTIACDSTDPKTSTEMAEDSEETFRAATLSPTIRYKMWCEVLECPLCTDDPKTALKLNIAVCPQEAEGFGCCTFDLDFCVPVGINPDGTCGGIYMWCDDYSVEGGVMTCHDEYGQG